MESWFVDRLSAFCGLPGATPPSSAIFKRAAPDTLMNDSASEFENVKAQNSVLLSCTEHCSIRCRLLTCAGGMSMTARHLSFALPGPGARASPRTSSTAVRSQPRDSGTPDTKTDANKLFCHACSRERIYGAATRHPERQSEPLKLRAGATSSVAARPQPREPPDCPARRATRSVPRVAVPHRAHRLAVVLAEPATCTSLRPPPMAIGGTHPSLPNRLKDASVACESLSRRTRVDAHFRLGRQVCRRSFLVRETTFA
jgi:hypothetical protein